jgi:ABC-type dipeptide/oligopeptide/nickel transport system permease subunit
MCRQCGRVIVMPSSGRDYLQQAPWITFELGAALFLTVLSLNVVGDAIRDALDPRVRVSVRRSEVAK